MNANVLPANTNPLHMKHPSHSHDSHSFPWNYFSAALVVFCLGHWLGTVALRGVEQAIPPFEHWPLLLAAFFLVILVGFSLLMRRAHHSCPRPRAWRDRAWQYSLALGVGLSAFFVAAGLEHWLQHGPLHLEHHAAWFTLGCVAALVCAERAFHHLQIRLERPRDIHPLLHLRQEAAEPVEGLILFVSTPTPGANLEVLDDTTTSGKHAVITFKDGKTASLQGAGHLATDIEAITAAGFWNWQQILRALQNHPALKQVILLGSESDKGSHLRLDLCQRFLAPYLPAGCEIKPHAQPLDFTNFNGLLETLRHIILHDFRALPMGRIAIDVTGGQTTASIAGAATTMNLDCVFQYVNTNKPYNVITYDVLHEGGPHLH